MSVRKDANNDAAISGQGCGGESISVLVVASYDSVNYALAEVADELLRRGHSVRVVTDGHVQGQNLSAFLDRGFEVEPVELVADSDLDSIDAVFIPPFRAGRVNALYDGIRERSIMTFAIASLFSSIAMRAYPDIVYAIGDSKLDEFEAYSLKYNFVVTGNPQYDGIIDACSHVDVGSVKRVLVIDQGAYPHGDAGKGQLAETLTRIAKSNPSMEFHLKPRYLPGRPTGAIHKLDEHLYDYFDEVPKNLHLMTEPSNLESLVPAFDAMITLWSTSYIDAIVADMPLLLLDGFDAIDVFDVRSQRVREAYDHLQATGCVFDYRDVSSLEGKLARVGDAYCSREVYERHSRAAVRIVDNLELCYRRFIVPGVRMKGQHTFTADDFSERIDGIETRDAHGDAHIATMAYYDALNAAMQDYVYRSRCMGNVLDLSPLMRHYDVDFGTGKIRPENLEFFLKQKRRALDAEFLGILGGYFEDPSTQEQLPDDVFLQDAYFDWLYETKQWGLLQKPPFDVKTEGSRQYNIARMYLDDGKMSRAFDHLLKALELLAGDSSVHLRRACQLNAVLAPFRQVKKGIPYYRHLTSRRYDHVFDFATSDAPKSNLIVAAEKMKRLNRAGCYEECLEYADETLREVEIRQSVDDGDHRSVADMVKKALLARCYRTVLREKRKAEKAGGRG